MRVSASVPNSVPLSVSIALFTADLRVYDNPVLQAAVRDAERVVPLFVVDTGIRRAGQRRARRTSRSLPPRSWTAAAPPG
ncbi:deoxyribodipyrimidine photo-lyase [Streptomyces cellulosae]|uniref:deoxyribodipyrimidine photo-lyase n=1 Tax=Streptomyces cellulosae TaxID=1968 RepID=UPI00099DDD93